MTIRTYAVALVFALASTMAVRPSAAIAHEPSPLGTNLAEICYWGTEYPFLDLFKSSSPWISGSEGTWDDRRPIDVDEFGWVRSLAPGQTVSTVLFSRDSRYPAGRYVAEYEGEGEIVWSESARLVERTPGRDVIEVDPAQGNLVLTLASVNPRNPLRKIRVPLPGVDAPNDENFHPAFLKANEHFVTVRMMGYTLTEWTDARDPLGWDDRPRVDDARWSEKGVPVEIMVELANRLGADPWFAVPHTADDGYVRSFAEVVRDRLKPGLRAWIEQSNEVWNPVFPQHEHAIRRGLALGLSEASDPDQSRYEAQYRHHVRRSLEIFALFEAVLGRDRLVRVLATNAGGTDYSRDLLNYANSARHVDVLATGGYFGYELGTDEWQSRVRGMTIDDLFRMLESETLPAVRQGMIADAAVAAEFGLPLVVYEGGQHLACQGSVSGDPVVTALFHAANRDPRMGRLYDRLLADWSTATGGRLFLHFQDCAWMNDGGSWGALEYIDQPRPEAPKFDALLRWMEASGQAGGKRRSESSGR